MENYNTFYYIEDFDKQNYFKITKYFLENKIVVIFLTNALNLTLALTNNFVSYVNIDMANFLVTYNNSIIKIAYQNKVVLNKKLFNLTLTNLMRILENLNGDIKVLNDMFIKINTYLDILNNNSKVR